MASRELDFASLPIVVPQFVMTSITPFGQSGPYSQCESEDIGRLVLGGLLDIGDYPETEPIADYGNQSCLAASQFAAALRPLGHGSVY